MSETGVLGVRELGARSYLYVPGDRPERFPKAVASGVDAVILDLEDAVAVSAKDAARDNVVEALDQASDVPCQLWVRVNQDERGIADLEALVGRGALTGVFVPKCTGERLAQVAPLLTDTAVIALVESARAVLDLAGLAASPVVTALGLGEVDLAADLGLDPGPYGEDLWPIRLSAVVASVAHDLLPPIGPVWLDVHDAEGLRASTELLSRRGFRARQAIHPNQVEIINAALSPTAEQVDAAAGLMAAAAAEDTGVWVDANGKMIDEAVLRTARRTLDQARRWGTSS